MSCALTVLLIKALFSLAASAGAATNAAVATAIRATVAIPSRRVNAISEVVIGEVWIGFKEARQRDGYLSRNRRAMETEME
jgi:hypothetical protein